MLLILAAVSISLALGQNGIIIKTQEGGKKYESVIDNYTYFWLSSAAGTGNSMCNTWPYGRGVGDNGNNIAFGVHLL